MWPFKSKEQQQETVLSVVKKLIFPPLRKEVADGCEFFLDGSLDTNLTQILNDLQDGINDQPLRVALQNCVDRVTELRKRLHIHSVIKSDHTTTTYMVSSNLNERNEPL
jgi:hypothetical protein